MVTINYRVGALGYLYLGGHGGDAWGAAANVGQLDQIAALQWVHDNIERFGGDPGNVTIFGQSAGGVAVSTLLAMPAANVLFHKAIAQSGTANRLGNTDFASAVTTQYLERLGIPDADPDRLRAVEIPDLLKAQGPRGPLSPVVDGDSLPQQPLQAVRDGHAAHIALMVGTARDEQKLYVAADRPEIDDAELERQALAYLPRRASRSGGRSGRPLPRVAPLCGDCRPRTTTSPMPSRPRHGSAFPRRNWPRPRQRTGPRRTSIRSTGSRPLGAARSVLATRSRSPSCSAPSGRPATTA